MENPLQLALRAFSPILQTFCPWKADTKVKIIAVMQKFDEKSVYFGLFEPFSRAGTICPPALIFEPIYNLGISIFRSI